MKLSIFDRILLALLLIVAIVSSFVLFGMAANIIQQTVVEDFIGLFYLYRQNALILAGAGLVLLLISLKLLFAGRGKGKKEAGPASTVMTQNENGGTYIALDVLDTMVKQRCSAETRISDCQTTIRLVDNGINIGVRLSVVPDTDLTALTTQLQQSLKDYIQNSTGIHVNEVGILIERAESPALPARAE